MVINARDVSGTGLEPFDLCIIGTGPAGMTIARELRKTGRRILLVECGLESENAAATALNDGSVDSPQGYPGHVLQEGRRRQYGGSAHLWNHEPRGQKDKFIRCVPMDEADFEARSWVEEEGWPFQRAELVPYYERAQAIFGMGPFAYDATSWISDLEARPPVETEVFHSSVSQFALPKSFLVDGKAELEGAENVRVLLGATLLKLERATAEDRIVGAELADREGRHFSIRASVFVLAAGGLENPRILLLNDAVEPGGLGNAHDLVGRCFMDHPSITLGTFVPYADSFFDRAGFYDQHLVRGQPVMGKLQLRPEVVRREQLLNLYAVLVPRFRDLHSNLPSIFRELLVKGPEFLRRHRPLQKDSEGRTQAPEAAVSLRQRLLEGYYSECYCGWSGIKDKPRHFGAFGVRALVELVPDRANRVQLGETKDAYGQRQLQIVWKWNETDLRSIRRTQEIFRSELAASGMGDFTPVDEFPGDCPRSFFSTHHFMGTTRMHPEAHSGVVDANCQVHGLENLFIAGSSVFPTGGCANPTLTLVALAVRLADHLGRRWATSG